MPDWSGPLNANQVAYLQDRSLYFLRTTYKLTGASLPDFVNSQNGKTAISRLAASALFGTDFNYATGQPSPEWNQASWTAAYNLVRANIAGWSKHVSFPPGATPPPATPPPPVTPMLGFRRR